MNCSAPLATDEDLDEVSEQTPLREAVVENGKDEHHGRMVEGRESVEVAERDTAIVVFLRRWNLWRVVNGRNGLVLAPLPRGNTIPKPIPIRSRAWLALIELDQLRRVGSNARLDPGGMPQIDF
jgi:hypothetical protein